jgi:hypothetical protein
VTAFRRSVIDGDWNTAEKGLSILGVRDGDSLRVRLSHSPVYHGLTISFTGRTLSH